jgi:hypothetical protein
MGSYYKRTFLKKGIAKRLLITGISKLKIERNFCSIAIENLLGYPAFQKLRVVKQKNFCTLALLLTP